MFCNFDNNCNEDVINAELINVCGWLCSNRLSLNVVKTKYVSFHTAQKTVIYSDLRVAQFNFLGLIISSDLKWHKHIELISLKISKVIGIMCHIKLIWQANILLTMYNALIMSHFNYCLLAWGSNIKPGHKLHLLQKALRITDGSHYIAHTEPICKKLQVVNLTDMF